MKDKKTRSHAPSLDLFGVPSRASKKASSSFWLTGSNPLATWHAHQLRTSDEAICTLRYHGGGNDVVDIGDGVQNALAVVHFLVLAIQGGSMRSKH